MERLDALLSLAKEMGEIITWQTEPIVDTFSVSYRPAAYTNNIPIRRKGESSLLTKEKAEGEAKILAFQYAQVFVTRYWLTSLYQLCNDISPSKGNINTDQWYPFLKDGEFSLFLSPCAFEIDRGEEKHRYEGQDIHLLLTLRSGKLVPSPRLVLSLHSSKDDIDAYLSKTKDHHVQMAMSVSPMETGNFEHWNIDFPIELNDAIFVNGSILQHTYKILAETIHWPMIATALTQLNQAKIHIENHLLPN